VNATAKVALAGGAGLLAVLWASAAHAKGNGGTAPPHPKPPAGDSPPDGPPTGPDEPPPDTEPPDVEPWENNAYPTPGRFYQVKTHDIFFGTDSDQSIVWRALLSAGWVAAKEFGRMDDRDAGAFARKFASDPARRLQYLGLILCLAYNDAAFGTWGWNRDYNTPGPHGRGIALVPSHIDNRGRLAAGLPAGRNMTLGSPGDLTSTPASPRHRSFPYLFLPALDLGAIARDLSVVPAEPMDLPIPWSYEAGDLPPDRRYGCGSGEREF
jgi:hypothetical protein